MPRPALPTAAAVLAVFALVAACLWWVYAEHAVERDEVHRGNPTIAKSVDSPSEPFSRDSSPPPPSGFPDYRSSALAGAVVREEHIVNDAQNRPVERWRLVELPRDPGRIARVVDYAPPRVTRDGGRVAQEIMAPDSVVVAVPAGTAAGALVERLRAKGFVTRTAREGDAVVVVQLDAATLHAVPEAIAALSAALPDVVTEPNFLQFPFDVRPNDYSAVEMWGQESIELPAAWTVSTGSASVVVAVIDTGIDFTHPDLVPNIWINPGETAGNNVDDDNNSFIDDVSGWNFAESNASAADADDHGTHVSGTIGAVGGNGQGLAGVNWNVRILPLRVGNRTFESANTLNALRYVNSLKARGVNIVAVNASFGGGSFSTLFRDELVNARDNGVLFVAAAGNDRENNDANPVYPGGYTVENIITVAATRPGDGLSSFSNFGKTAVDLGAPGTGIRSTVRQGGYEFFNGTSMAAPHVTGAAALIAAAIPGIFWNAIRDRILQNVDPVPALANVVATGGKLNVRRALAPALVPPAVTITRPAVRLVVMDRPGVLLAVGATLKQENGASANASLAWTTVDGPAAAAFVDAGAASTSVTFPVEGRYLLRVMATAGSFTRSDEMVVAVGAKGIAPPENGLVASWDFNDTGGIALDASAAGRNGVFVGNPARVPGIDRGGLRFDGVGGRVSFAAPTLPVLTISSWINPEATGGVSIFPRIVHMRSGLFFLGRDGGAEPDDGNLNTLKFARDTGIDRRVWFAPPGTAGGGKWSHVAVAFDETEGVSATPRLWFEGRPQVVGIQPSPASPPAVAVAQGYIGDRGDGGRTWNGAMDELRIYNRILDPAEIAVLAQGPLLRDVLASRMAADLSGGTLSFAVGLSGSDGGMPPFAASQVFWSTLAGGGLVTNLGPLAAAISLPPGAGASTLRLEFVANGTVHVVRTLPVSAVTSLVDPLSHYSGLVSDGGVFALEVGPDRKGTFIGGASGGLSGRSFTISPFGSFSFAASDGTFVTGQVRADGSIAGTIGSSATFMGDAPSTTQANGASDGRYEGWILRDSVRASAIVANGMITIAVEEFGGGRTGSGEVGAAGEFAFTSALGASFAGAAGAGRIDGTFVPPEGGAPRSIVMLRDGRVPDARLVNLSARGQAGASTGAIVAGFVVRGAGDFPLLLRAVGPGLTAFGVGQVLAQPNLELQSGGIALAENSGWDAGPGAGGVAAAMARVGAFGLLAGSHDAALVANVSNGAYTASITGTNGADGNVLAELFDARTVPSAARLVNISARARIGEGDFITIGGFVIEGTDPALVLIRAAGPSLAGLGVADALPLTSLSVRQGDTLIARAEAWSDGAAARVVGEAAGFAGAFGFEDRSADAALLLYLPPGVYTAQASGREGLTGVALVEVYLVNED